ncbi:MAG: GNAT family N-acetyltransferase [Chitinophagaceae bacterium]|nr:GNAT family N-acetyltransferase [Chitinophagaceae bacterium]
MTNNIKTARLRLEYLAPQDRTFMLELMNTPGWLAFIGDRNIHTLEAAEQYIEKIRSNPGMWYWVAKLNNGETPIGIITLIKRHYLEYHDIGFAFLPQYSGQGYGFEAADAVLKIVLQNPAHPRVLATTIPGNVNSIKLLEKLGLRWRQRIRQGNDDLEVYSIG